MRSFIRLALPFAAAVAGSVQAQQPATVDGATAAANDTSAHSGIPHTFIIEYAAVCPPLVVPLVLTASKGSVI